MKIVGRGIESALVDTVCAWAKQQGYRIVLLSTFRGIPWNAPFYSKLGFHPVNEAELTPGFQQIRHKEEGVAIRPGSSWMSARGWNEVHWRITRQMWERRLPIEPI